MCEKVKYEAIHLFGQTYLLVKKTKKETLKITVLSLQKYLRIGFVSEVRQ